jgi:hypothetical protein
VINLPEERSYSSTARESMALGSTSDCDAIDGVDAITGKDRNWSS